MVSQRREQFHHLDFLYCILNHSQVDQDQSLQIQGQIQDLPLQIPLDQQLKPHFHNNGIKSLGNQFQSRGMVIERHGKKVIKFRAKANVCSRHCSVGASQRKMKCFTLIWMNIEVKIRGLYAKTIYKYIYFLLNSFISGYNVRVFVFLWFNSFILHISMCRCDRLEGISITN